MTGLPTTPVRLWRRGPWSRNPLTRPGDRLESVLVLAVTVWVLILVPFAAAFGTATHTRLDAQTSADRATLQQVPAVLAEDALPGKGDVPARWPQDSAHARAQWSVQGVPHTGDVTAPAGSRAGETVSVWIDAQGDLVAAPATGTDNAVTAGGAAVTVWVAGAMGGVVLLLGVYAATTRYNMAQWDAEWNEIDNPPGRQVS